MRALEPAHRKQPFVQIIPLRETATREEITSTLLDCCGLRIRDDGWPVQKWRDGDSGMAGGLTAAQERERMMTRISEGSVLSPAGEMSEGTVLNC